MAGRRMHGSTRLWIATRSALATVLTAFFVTSLTSCISLTHEQAIRTGEAYKRRHEHRQIHSGTHRCRCDDRRRACDSDCRIIRELLLGIPSFLPTGIGGRTRTRSPCREVSLYGMRSRPAFSLSYRHASPYVVFPARCRMFVRTTRASPLDLERIGLSPHGPPSDGGGIRGKSATPIWKRSARPSASFRYSNCSAPDPRARWRCRWC